MEQFSFAILVILWIGILLWGSKYIEWLWVTALGFMPFRIFVAPGIVVHEYSHALACLVTGTKIREIKLFKREGGHVIHDRPAATYFGVPWLGRSLEQPHGAARLLRFRFLSQFLISFAPVFGCLACIWLLGLAANQFFGEPVSPVTSAQIEVEGQIEPVAGPFAMADGAALPLASTNGESDRVVRSANNLGEFLIRFFERVWVSFGELINPLVINPLLGIIYLWLLLSLTIGMAPSSKDIMNSLYGIFVVCVLLVLISMALATDSAMAQRTMEGVLPMMAYTTAVMAFALIVTSIVAPTIIGVMRRM